MKEGLDVKFSEYVKYLLSNRLNDNFDPATCHAVMGMASEAGELLNKYKKYWFYEGEILDKVDTLIEMSDLLHFFQQMANCLDVSLELLIEVNLAKLITRYPDGYDHNRAVTHKRDKAAERAAVIEVLKKYGFDENGDKTK